jgi:hypothetical protein
MAIKFAKQLKELSYLNVPLQKIKLREIEARIPPTNLIDSALTAHRYMLRALDERNEIIIASLFR